MSEINFHYAYQLCDTQSRENKPRISGNDRTLLSKKCLISFLNSITFMVKNFPNSVHTICFFNDRSSPELLEFVNKIIEKFSSKNIILEIRDTKPGILESIKECYYWLKDNGIAFVYQVQDDYLFYDSAIYEMYKVQNQVKFETGYDLVVSPFNDFWLWLTVYRNSCTPRTILCGEKRYWIQYYDMSCSFMTTVQEFNKHWDLYHMFFELLEKGDSKLESGSLNFMLTQRGAFGFIPVNSLAFHMQSELEEDPHIDWRPLWNSIDVSLSTT